MDRAEMAHRLIEVENGIVDFWVGSNQLPIRAVINSTEVIGKKAAIFFEYWYNPTDPTVIFTTRLSIVFDIAKASAHEDEEGFSFNSPEGHGEAFPRGIIEPPTYI